MQLILNGFHDIIKDKWMQNIPNHSFMDHLHKGLYSIIANKFSLAILRWIHIDFLNVNDCFIKEGKKEIK